MTLTLRQPPAVSNSIYIADAICRTDLASFSRRCFHTLSPAAEFLPNWHIDALAFNLEQVRLGKITRLIVNFPPRTLKSVLCSVAFPAFVLGHDSSKRIIVVSYGTDLAAKLAHDFRAILAALWYRRIFPGVVISLTKNTEFEVVTSRNGSRLAVSIDGALTGRGADIIIVDDPLKAMDGLSDNKRERVNDLFNSTVLTRLDNKRTGAVVVVMQRLHEHDLSGMLQRSATPWTTLNYPAIAQREERIRVGENTYHLSRVGDVLHPRQEPLATLEATRAQLGSYFFAAHYLQEPIPSRNAMIPRAWIRRYDYLPQPTYQSRFVLSWDTASGESELSDYSACAIMMFHEGQVYLVDMLRERLVYSTLRERAIALACQYGANEVLIEDTGVGSALVADLIIAGQLVRAIKPQQSKKIRMAVQSHKFENGTVLLPKYAPWLADLEEELFAFPHSRHDDQIDAISQALEYSPPPYKRTDSNEDPYQRTLRLGQVYGGWLR
jgi:predicted phage terminase large subunit-like protein